MTSTKPTILIQLDTDPHPSVFDAVVAIDAGVDHLLRHGGVRPEDVRNLVHGALFTRGVSDLNRTALFVGGSNVLAGEELLGKVKECFFAGFRVSVLFDPNGSNTTAAAAVLAVMRADAEAEAGPIHGTPVALLGATGPVGQRIARLLARLGAQVSVGSRQIEKARATSAQVREATGCDVIPFDMADPDTLTRSLEPAEVVIAAGAAGVALLPQAIWRALPNLRLMIDLNAVPPLGIEGVVATDKNTDRNGVRAWGALGVGGIKMKIHRQAVQELFTANDKVLDAEEILEIGRELEAAGS